MGNYSWTPVSSGLMPDDMEVVQVTYIGYHDKKPYCDAFAYMNKSKWYWLADDVEAKVKITAWKKNCMPYTEE